MCIVVVIDINYIKYNFFKYFIKSDIKLILNHIECISSSEKIEVALK